MAEDVLSRREPMAIPQREHQRRMTRRSLLRKGRDAAVVAAGIGLGLVGSDHLIASPNVPENRKTVFDTEFTPTEIIESVEISTEELIIRERPSVTEDGESKKVITPDIPFALIKRLGNFLYEGQKRIIMQNVPVVKGQDPITFRNTEGRWIKVRIQQANRLGLGPLQEKDGFINLGPATSKQVVEHGVAAKITGVKDGIVTTTTGDIKIEEVGIVTPLTTTAK